MFRLYRTREARIGRQWVRVSAIAALVGSGCWHSQAEDATGPVAALVTTQATAPASAVSKSGLTADQALQRLIAGNERYVTGTATHPDQTIQRRAEVAKGQFPFAIVLTCSDSRVAPELLLDQGLGDLFVIRNAGNILDDHVIGSMEYAVEHLHVPLVLVVGHEKCGAISAAVAGGEASGHIHSLVEAIEPVVKQVKNLPGDPVENVVRANAQRIAETLTRSEPILKEAVNKGKLLVVPARYDLVTGHLEILKLPAPTVSKPQPD